MFDKEAIEQLQQSEAIEQANLATIEAITLNKTAVVALPSNFQKHDLEAFMPHRRRARGVMHTESIAAFVAYANEHHEDGASIFVNAAHMSAEAVLNLGTPDSPGHADNSAVVTLERSAAYAALKKHTDQNISQTQAAEFFEDWPAEIRCFKDSDSSEQIHVAKVVAALRKITIEAMRKLENTEQNLSASRSTFESVQATSTEAIPTIIYFTCRPYADLPERQFVLRLGIKTGDNKPQIILRIVNEELHSEKMAQEFVTKLQDTFAAASSLSLPVHVGSYSKG
jgi:uncharacterized protein YfdQ (DUF2303 family)